MEQLMYQHACDVGRVWGVSIIEDWQRYSQQERCERRTRSHPPVSTCAVPLINAMHVPFWSVNFQRLLKSPVSCRIPLVLASPPGRRQSCELPPPSTPQPHTAAPLRAQNNPHACAARSMCAHATHHYFSVSICTFAHPPHLQAAAVLLVGLPTDATVSA